MNNNRIKTHTVVLGSGPAGYSAAFRCADLGLKTTIVERYDNLGGVCLNVGCIPSKTLLNIVRIIEEAKSLSSQGVLFNDPKIDLNGIRKWKNEVINRLTEGLKNMSKGRKIEIVNGIGKFVDSNTLEVKDRSNNNTIVNFENAIIAAGSRPTQLSFFPYDDPRIWNSTNALELKEIPKRMLVIGGGIIGLEISTIYHSLGSEIDIVETLDQIISSADKDIVEVFATHINKKFNIMLETKVKSIKVKKDKICVFLERKNSDFKEVKSYDVILVAIGRIPNSKNIHVEKAGIKVDKFNFISVDKQLRTNVENIFAIGDIVGHPMLAHKGMHEGHVAAEVIAGMNHFFDPKVIPSVVYTEPEVGWVGLTEKEIEKKKENFNYEIATFPWVASGRAIASNCSNGITKLIFEKKTRRIVGGAIVGRNAGELLGEISLAIEMGCDVEDISLTIHAHPTLYESLGMAAKIFEGSITDLPNLKIINK